MKAQQVDEIVVEVKRRRDELAKLRVSFDGALGSEARLAALGGENALIDLLDWLGGKRSSSKKSKP